MTACLSLIDINLSNVVLNAYESSCEDSINLINASGNIKEVNIKDSFLDGLDIDFSTIEIFLANIDNAKNDCLDVSAGVYEFKNLNLKNCGDKGISVGEKSNVLIDRARIGDTNIGIASKDSSVTKLNNLSLKNLKVCVSAYNKKQEFSGGFLKADKVFGPGNQYVAEAKKQLFGVIGIDLPAGPSEVLVIANEKSKASWIAYDILAQAEHDPNAKTYVVSSSQKILDNVMIEIKNIIKSKSLKNVNKSISRNCFLILASSKKDIYDISNFIAPEHLHIHTKFNKNLLKNIVHAGSVFVGEKAPVALGDYTIGTNHVLPTDQTARFSSGLGVDDFIKKTVFIDVGEKTLKKISKPTIDLARQEGLEAHALSVEIRKIKT